MMGLVRIALKRPYTFVVMAVLIAILGIGSILSMPTDIFPAINIPVVSIIWSYTGISPDDMEKRVVTICERALTTTVNDIEHMESRSYKRRLRDPCLLPPNVERGYAISQITSLVQQSFELCRQESFRPLSLSMTHRRHRFSS